MTGEKENFFEALEDMPNPADDQVDPPTPEDDMEDLEREGEEQAGLRPAPYKTFPFWLSMIATILVYILGSNIVPEDTQLWMILTFLSSAFAHMGYDHALKVFGLYSEYFQSDPNKPTYKKPTYYVSFLATMASYGLGAGLSDQNIVVQGAGLVAMVLGYLGVSVTAWIKRHDMADPAAPDENFFIRLYGIIYNAFRGKPADAPVPGEEEATQTPENPSTPIPESETSEPINESEDI